MVRIAMVEDDPADLEQLRECLRRYEEEHSERFSVMSFSNPTDFLNACQSDYDLVLMDIELPLFDGMEAARRLRQTDPAVTLVFITNMEQYAINGYAVDALDFVVKPINYYRFSSMLRKALRNIARQEEKEVVVQSAGKITRLRLSQIYYVEIRDHLLIYCTSQGRLESWGKLADVEQALSDHGFARCSSSHLVNLRHVVSVAGNSVDVAGTKLPISQRKRKTFYTCVTDYLSRK